MSVDPIDDAFEDLRRVRDAAISADTGDELVDAYEHGAIMMAWNQTAGSTVEHALTDTLRIQLLGTEQVDAYTLGTVSKAVQNAIAKVDRGRRLPASSQTAVDKADRARAELIQEAQVGNTVVFRVPAAFQEPGGYDIGRQPSRAAVALRELIETLPRDAEDDLAIDAILGSPHMVRLAVQDISRAAKLAPAGMSFDLETAIDEIRSILTLDRAQRLDEELANKDIKEDEETVTGLLDGFRTTRRVFYMIRDGGPEIVGSVDGDLLAAVRRLAGSRVTARVATTQWRRKSGKLGPKHYRLLGLEAAAEQQPMFE